MPVGVGVVKIWGTQPDKIDEAEDRDRWMALLERLGHASSKADEGSRESRGRLGWETIPSSSPADSPLPTRR